MERHTVGEKLGIFNSHAKSEGYRKSWLLQNNHTIIQYFIDWKAESDQIMQSYLLILIQMIRCAIVIAFNSMSSFADSFVTNFN